MSGAARIACNRCAGPARDRGLDVHALPSPCSSSCCARDRACVFWVAALTQAALWTLVPALFYAAPPGDLPLVLAIGHEFQLGTDFGPPLAFWLAEVAFRIGGMFGVYLLSQICIVVDLLGGVRARPRHRRRASRGAGGAADGRASRCSRCRRPISVRRILAMPLWALILLHYWRAIGKRRRGYWFALALEIGLLLLTTYAGIVADRAAAGLFAVEPERGRGAIRHRRAMDRGVSWSSSSCFRICSGSS